jgi:hypothetical protein
MQVTCGPPTSHTIIPNSRTLGETLPWQRLASNIPFGSQEEEGGAFGRNFLQLSLWISDRTSTTLNILLLLSSTPKNPEAPHECLILTVQWFWIRQVLFELFIQIFAYTNILKHALKFGGILKTTSLLKWIQRTFNNLYKNIHISKGILKQSQYNTHI